MKTVCTCGPKIGRLFCKSNSRTSQRMPESSGVATNDGGESNTHDRQGSSKKENDLTKSSKLYLGSTNVLIRSDHQKVTRVDSPVRTFSTCRRCRLTSTLTNERVILRVLLVQLLLVQCDYLKNLTDVRNGLHGVTTDFVCDGGLGLISCRKEPAMPKVLRLLPLMVKRSRCDREVTPGEEGGSPGQ
jgi:hypothetical protein